MSDYDDFMKAMLNRALSDAQVRGSDRLTVTVAWKDNGTGIGDLVFDATIPHSDGIQRGPRMCRVHDDCRALPALGNACAEVTNE